MTYLWFSDSITSDGIFKGARRQFTSISSKICAKDLKGKTLRKEVGKMVSAFIMCLGKISKF